MGRRQYKHVKLTCHRGINQQRGLATLEECAEASNVWAPNGVVEQRPGYVGVVSFPIEHSSDRTNTSTTQTMIRYWPEAGTPYVTYAEGATMILDKVNLDTRHNGSRDLLCDDQTCNTSMLFFPCPARTK